MGRPAPWGSPTGVVGLGRFIRPCHTGEWNRHGCRCGRGDEQFLEHVLFPLLIDVEMPFDTAEATPGRGTHSSLSCDWQVVHRNFERIAATTDPYSRSSATSKVRASERRECLSSRNGTALADGYRCDQLPW